MDLDPFSRLEMHSQAWYNEYFRRADTSPTHAKFCKRVYGVDLCQHGLMQMEELDFLVGRLEMGKKILEIGCGNGYITEYIHDRTSASILGLDYSDTAITQAAARTEAKAATLQFQQVDLNTEAVPGGGYETILLIDSIYFLGDLAATVQKFIPKLGSGGQLVITFFEALEDDTPTCTIAPQETTLARALAELGLTYTWHDFTREVRQHGLRNYEAAEALKAQFEAEGNRFLYEARAAENRKLREKAEKNIVFRYQYWIKA